MSTLMSSKELLRELYALADQAADASTFIELSGLHSLKAKNTRARLLLARKDLLELAREIELSTPMTGQERAAALQAAQPTLDQLRKQFVSEEVAARP